MTVYVDDMGLLKAIYNGAKLARRARWSHLMADTHDQLIVFAVSELHMAPEWIQKPFTPGEHFDVTETRREMALRKGAVPITFHEAGRLVIAKRDGVPFDLEAVRRDRAS